MLQVPNESASPADAERKAPAAVRCKPGLGVLAVGDAMPSDRAHLRRSERLVVRPDARLDEEVEERDHGPETGREINRPRGRRARVARNCEKIRRYHLPDPEPHRHIWNPWLTSAEADNNGDEKERVHPSRRCIKANSPGCLEGAVDLSVVAATRRHRDPDQAEEACAAYRKNLTDPEAVSY